MGFWSSLFGGSDEYQPTEEEQDLIEQADGIDQLTEDSPQEDFEQVYDAENALADSGILKGQDGWVKRLFG